VAGALRSSRIGDGVILEVGGTSTNVAAIRRGRPALSYVQVASHATAIRALDVRVFGVAGGSMLRSRRNRVYGVGPRSAHIAGLPYACFLGAQDVGEIEDAAVELVAPRPGDPADYLTIRLADGRQVALTITCAANALGLVADEDYARGDRDAALAAFAVAGRCLRLPADEVARRMLQAATQAVGDLVAAVTREHHLERPVLVAVGGGAGALGRAVATAMGLEIVIPPHAEVISAIGDALSLVRVERERTLPEPTAADTDRLIAEAEAEAVAAGASAAGLEVRVEHVTARSSIRVTVTGAVGLSSGALPGREPVTPAEAAAAAQARGYPGTAAHGLFWLATDAGRGGRVALFDRYGELVIDVRGETVELDGDGSAALAAVLARRTRRVGPVTIAPEAWLISGPRLLQLPAPTPPSIVDAVSTLAADGEATTIVIGRE
jgi:N-methylhydantoinase A/oxoprolinase/acetone carboxylase beta subunit